MSVYIERLWILFGFLLLAWALVAVGFRWALWAGRTGRVDAAGLKRRIG